jgi:hypothetical protein
MTTAEQTPFQLKVMEIRAAGATWQEIAAGADGVRSHAWWKAVASNGAWGSAGSGGRIAPPPPSAFGGIAKLFGVTVEQVREMIAADWYGIRVQPAADSSLTPEARDIAAALTGMSGGSVRLVREIVLKLHQLDTEMTDEGFEENLGESG